MEAKGKIHNEKINGKENDLEAEGEVYSEETNPLYIEKDNFEASNLYTTKWISQMMIMSYAKSCFPNLMEG